MVREGGPSTNLLISRIKVVGGGPSPAMTGGGCGSLRPPRSGGAVAVPSGRCDRVGRLWFPPPLRWSEADTAPSSTRRGQRTAARRLPTPVMAREGGPSTNLLISRTKVVDGGPSPAMTGGRCRHFARYDGGTVATSPDRHNGWDGRSSPARHDWGTVATPPDHHDGPGRSRPPTSHGKANDPIIALSPQAERSGRVGFGGWVRGPRPRTRHTRARAG